MSWLTISEYHLLIYYKTGYTIILDRLLFMFYMIYSLTFRFCLTLYLFHLVPLQHLVLFPCLRYLSLPFRSSWLNRESSLPWLTRNPWINHLVMAYPPQNTMLEGSDKMSAYDTSVRLKCLIKLKCHTLTLHEVGRKS